MGLETDAIAAQYDALRAKRAIGNDLLIQTGSRQGMVTTATITSGWLPESLKPDRDGDQTMKLRIAEHLGWDTFVMGNVSAVVFNNLRYRTKSAPLKPSGEPFIWIINLNPTGEAIEVMVSEELIGG